MSNLFAFVLTEILVCLGIGVGTYLAIRGNRLAAPVAAAPVTAQLAVVAASPSLTAEDASVFLLRIQQVATTVDAGVGRHATRVAEISGGLSTDGTGGIGEIVRAAAQMQEANRQLQQDLTEARAEIESQRNQIKSYMAQAMSDPLTGLANRRAFDQELTRRLAERSREGPALSLAIVDIDHFKRLNDEHGHQAGDAVLSQLAGLLTGSTRQMDLAARYGGEEFGLVLPGTSAAEGEVVAEWVRGAIEGHDFQYEGTHLSVTVSVGLAEAAGGEDAADLIGRADTALYAAKESGRNACQVHDGTCCLPLEKRAVSLTDRSELSEPVAPVLDGCLA